MDTQGELNAGVSANTEDSAGLQTHRLADYMPPEWLVETVKLRFELDEADTLVHAELALRRNSAAPSAGATCRLPPVILDGRELELLDIRIDGEPAPEGSWCTTPSRLVITDPPADAFTLSTTVRIHPNLNKALLGLYVSNGIFATQCEAEGFRRITFFPDRPDVLARYTVRIEADKARCPVLLSNGNLLEQGDLNGGRHYAVWEDPFPKPCYLFALVAGKLEAVRDVHTTPDGRTVQLAVWTEPGKAERARWALASLKRAMRWDEQRFGLACDLDVYNVVAIADFNMGAMENKGLNIFNDKYVLADADTATDTDYENIEAIIGHEYFHNWTGNRITCRDWFQLCLKEGLTVFRDQEFTSDVRSRAVKRLADVRLLKTAQWPEDDGPLAHPVRPSQYHAIENLYTATVYEKGAEVVRMLHTLLGPVGELNARSISGDFRAKTGGPFRRNSSAISRKGMPVCSRKAPEGPRGSVRQQARNEDGFMAGMRTYVQRHDGQAVTVEDFIRCFEDATGRDLKQFFRWYEQAGTPRVEATWQHDAENGTLRLTLRQHTPPTPGQEEKLPLHIPLRLALFDRQGQRLEPHTDDGIVRDGEVLLELTEAEQTFTFRGIEAAPVVSLNRGFSAPVRIIAPLTEDDLLLLLAHEDDGVARAEAAQRLWTALILQALDDGMTTETAASAEEGDAALLPELRARAERLADALAAAITDLRQGDPALLAELLLPPGMGMLLNDIDGEVDPAALHAARNAVMGTVGRLLDALLRESFDAAEVREDYAPTPEQAARRTLRAAILALLVKADPQAGAKLAYGVWQQATNMTERAAAMQALAQTDTPQREQALAEYMQRYGEDALMMDRWLSWQAMWPFAPCVHTTRELMESRWFTLDNPNRVRALLGGFAHANPVCFTAADGSGFALIAEAIRRLDAINPTSAARLATAFRIIGKLPAERRQQAEQHLRKLLEKPGLSQETRDIIARLLGTA